MSEVGERYVWMVADTSNPDRRYSPLDPNHFEPEFGPFATYEEAMTFAAMRPAYEVQRAK